MEKKDKLWKTFRDLARFIKKDRPKVIVESVPAVFGGYIITEEWLQRECYNCWVSIKICGGPCVKHPEFKLSRWG